MSVSCQSSGSGLYTGFLCGEPGRFHYGASHSLVVGLVAGLIFYRFVGHKFTGISRRRILGCCLFSLLSHPILEYFSADTPEPFDTEYYMSSFPLFRDVQRNQDTLGIFFSTII